MKHVLIVGQHCRIRSLNNRILELLLNPAVPHVRQRPTAGIEIQEQKTRPIGVRARDAEILPQGGGGSAV